MSKSKARRSDPTLAIMSNRAQKMMEVARRSARSQGPTETPRSQAPPNSSGGSNNPSRDMRAPVSHTSNHVRSITGPSTRSRNHGSSTPEATRSNKRPREDDEAIVRCPGKEPVLEVSSDEDIESTMNYEFPRAGGISIDSSFLELEDEGKARKVFQATNFKKDQVNLGQKILKHNLKKGSRDLIFGYVHAGRAFKDLDKSKKKLKDQFTLVRGYAASCKEAEKKRKEAEDELHRKDEQLIDTIEKLTARNVDVEAMQKKIDDMNVEALQKKIDDMNVELQRLKLESNESYENGRAEGLSMSARPSREKKLAIPREYNHSHVYKALSDMKAGVELFGVFDKGWKHCKKLGFLNEHALDPMKNDDCEPFLITENVEVGPSLEEDEYYPMYLEMMDSVAAEVNVEPQELVSDQLPAEIAADQTIRGQVEEGLHQALTQEQIDGLIDQVPGERNDRHEDAFDHIDVTNLVGGDPQTHN
ncbi:hypothetical protein ACJIZ3_019809 [Penstemon smallii]|uniref:Uncharacterized protein n=1 Tax=Penstemon smallii TaxID=265156 RepID=A0ABD3T3S6_9LAMI